LIGSIIAIFKIDHFIGKFVFYWISHLTIVLLAFSVWQIADGYLFFTGIAGIFKIFFYVTITAIFPMVLVSVVWVFWIATVTDEIKQMIDKGVSPEEAYSRSSRRKLW
jgi:hypothetical protein